ncbi:hypothetical protein F5Y16DRAFT_423631 [Xylariaceae sp. FL0255]|nr:hypothetical protein F5Y16DRAFT_423631 [Xylariaceae sp. FL0255]
MEGLSVAASGIAVVSLAIQLYDECIRLKDFWVSVRDAPEEVAAITHDLMLLSAILKDISNGEQISFAVSMGLSSCRLKIEKLKTIVEDLEATFQSDSRVKRIWGGLKTTAMTKRLREFRESLNETKSTVMLGIMAQSIQAPKTPEPWGNALNNYDTLAPETQPPAYAPHDEQWKSPTLDQGRSEKWLPVDQLKNECRRIVLPEPIHNTSMTSNRLVREFLQKSMQIAVDDLFSSGTIEGLLDNTINQVTEFETHLQGTHRNDGSYEVDNSAKGRCHQESKKNPFDNSTRASRVCHRTSSVGVLFGSIWVRTSTLRLAKKSSTAAGGDFQITTSFIFYPSAWLIRIGLGQGVEASLKNSKDGWKFDFNPIRAVPDNSLIFELCKDGDMLGVQRLLKRQEASLKDTSPQGWTPLHFAAEAGHVDLCEMLIKDGADKRALVFKGPSPDALSPITIFAVANHHLPAEHKIRMLRLFDDCLELTDPSGDGWTVHAELKRSYNKEKVPIPENAITWMLRSTASEEFIAFGPKTIWTATQCAVRSFLVQERNEQILQKLLRLSPQQKKAISSSHATGIAHWLALRASERELLPMVIDAGRLCQISGFTWIQDDLTPSQFVKALPVIYRAWAVAFPSNMDTVESAILSELEVLLEKEKWNRESLLSALPRKDEGGYEWIEKGDENVEKLGTEGLICSGCGDDYSSLGIGVVSPARIAFLECAKTGHEFNCACASYLEASGALPSPPPYSVESEYSSPFEEEAPEEGVEEELPLVSGMDITSLCEEFIASRQDHTNSYDHFTEAASLLYRAQGRTWTSEYRFGEKFCATCFLLREEYIGKDGLGTETSFSKIPDSFLTWRLSEAACTFDKEF